MTLKVHIRPEAQADLEEAAAWYERRRVGFGQEFLDEVLNALATIAENPMMYPVVHKEIRRAVIHRFPFGVFYLIDEDEMVVAAIMHGSRHPRRWKERV